MQIGFCHSSSGSGGISQANKAHINERFYSDLPDHSGSASVAVDRACQLRLFFNLPLEELQPPVHKSMDPWQSTDFIIYVSLRYKEAPRCLLPVCLDSDNECQMV